MISFPNAKINIGLNIISRRNDGFHTIETVFYPVQWCDVLEIVPDETQKTPVQFKNSGIKLFSKEKQNLCIRACELLSEKHGLPKLKIHLHKIIPVGAGLGGGSADASFTLVMLNKLFGLKIGDEQLQQYASLLGSDCAFFIRNKPVYATGKGDQFEEIKLNLDSYFIVVVKPKVRISTAKAYSGVSPAKPTVSLKELIKLPVGKWKDSIQNDFERTVFPEYAVIRNIRKKLYQYGAVYASMSGSGSAVYGIFTEEKNSVHRSGTAPYGAEKCSWNVPAYNCLRV